MRYVVASIVVLLCLLGAGVAVWQVQQSALAPFILPEATSVKTDQPRIGTTLITYNAEARTWRKRLTQQLTHAGWQVRAYNNPGATTLQWEYVSWYTRDMRLGPILFHEHAQFLIDENDPTRVNLQIDRSIAFRP